MLRWQAACHSDVLRITAARVRSVDEALPRGGEWCRIGMVIGCRPATERSARCVLRLAVGQMPVASWPSLFVALTDLIEDQDPKLLIDAVLALEDGQRGERILVSLDQLAHSSTLLRADAIGKSRGMLSIDHWP